VTTGLLWERLSEKQQRMLINHVRSFGIDTAVAHEPVEGSSMILPNENEAYSIAVEMFTLSHSIIKEIGG
jgi:hypothetical protein